MTERSNKSNSESCAFCGVEFYRGDWKEKPEDAVTPFDHDCEGMKVDHVDVGECYFACRCSGEARAECEWIMAEALRLMKTTPAMLLTNAVFHLEINYMASITGIQCDQWAGIGAATYPEDAEDSFTPYVQCDRVEDGVAAIYMAFYQHFGPERKHDG